MSELSADGMIELRREQHCTLVARQMCYCARRCLQLRHAAIVNFLVLCTRNHR